MAIQPDIEKMADGAKFVPERFAVDADLAEKLKLTEFFLGVTGSPLVGNTIEANAKQAKDLQNAPANRNEGIRHALAVQAIFQAAERAAIVSEYIEEHGDEIRAHFSNIQNKTNAEADEVVKNRREIIQSDLKEKGFTEKESKEAANKIMEDSATPEQLPTVKAAIERLDRNELTVKIAGGESKLSIIESSMKGSPDGAALAQKALHSQAINGTHELIGFSDAQLIELANFQKEQATAIARYIEEMPEQLVESKKILDELNASKEDIDALAKENPEVRSLLGERLAKLDTNIKAQTAKVEFEEAAVAYIEEHGDALKGLGAEELFSKVMSDNPELVEQYKSLSTATPEEIEAYAKAHDIEPEALMAAYQQSQESQQIMALTSQTIATMAQYEDRHEFLRSNTVSSLWQAFVEADPLTDSQGRMVYADANNRLYTLEKNEDGSLTLDDKGDAIRTPYTDPLEVAQLRAQAWGEPHKMYANETRAGEDPQNGILERGFESDLFTDDAIATATEGLADPELKRDLAQEAAYKSAMEALDGHSAMSRDEFAQLSERLGLDASAIKKLETSLTDKGIEIIDSFASTLEVAETPSIEPPLNTSSNNYTPKEPENTTAPVLGS